MPKSPHRATDFWIEIFDRVPPAVETYGKVQERRFMPKILCPGAFAVLEGRHPHILLKYLMEVVGITEADVVGDFRH